MVVIVTSNDWPVPLRVITEDDERKFPKHDRPEQPNYEQMKEHKRQVDEEKVKGHPANDAKEPPLEPDDDSPDDDA